MGVTVDVWVWKQFSMAPGAEVDWTFWMTGADGISMIDPEHFYWMNAVPDYEPDPNPDVPAYATGLTFTEQGASRAYENPAGANNAVWKATLKTPSGADEGLTWFRPRMIVAPGS